MVLWKFSVMAKHVREAVIFLRNSELSLLVVVHFLNMGSVSCQ